MCEREREMVEAANNGSKGGGPATADGGEAECQLHFVMVHGVGHGAWCWYKIRCLIESSDHKVTCLDLKSAGIDPSDASSVLTFSHYNQPLLDFLSFPFHCSSLEPR